MPKNPEITRYQINYFKSGIDGDDDMTLYNHSRLLSIEHERPTSKKKKSKKNKPKEEPKKNEFFFFVIVENIHLKCSNCFMILDRRISKAEDLPDDPSCSGFKKISAKCILIGTELLQIKNIRGENHFIHFLTEGKCFFYLKSHDKRENLNYKSTEIWNIPINKGIG